MSDEISQEERILIDAAIKAGKVKKIPTGQSGIQYEVVNYKERHNQLQSQYMKNRKQAGENKRKRIKYLLNQNKTITEIAEEMDLDPRNVGYHIRRIREMK